MGEFSITHILLFAAVALLFFGPSRLPQLGQSLGKAIRNFKDGMNEINGEAKDLTQEKPPKPQEMKLNSTVDRSTEAQTDKERTDQKV